MDAFRFSPRPNRAHEIRWREWGPEAFEEASRLDRPILLAVSAVWCHWCHVMDETSYSDPRVIELLNREYVPIRVDNDRHPEVNQRYNMGGWPTTAFLTPRGDILTGATYLPSEGLESAARQVLQFYRTRKAELYSRILERKAKASLAMAPSPVPTEAAERVLELLDKTYDPEHGGFGTEPKFPQAEALELVLEEYHRTGDGRWGEMASKTLRAMVSGGLFDHVAGGFFRYSTTRDWGVPHYEKMAEDNAALLRVLLHGARALDDPELARAAARVVDYALAYLHDTTTGAFYGSQDADEEYYQLSAEERDLREPPFVDRTVYTNWCASMAASFLEAAHILERPDLAETALKSLDFLWNELYRAGEGMHHYYDGRARGNGLLVDQVWTLAGLLQAYESTGAGVYLERAGILAELICGRFRDPVGGFFDTWEDYEALGRLQDKDKSIVDNSLAAEGLARLSYLTGREEYRQAAEQALQAFASDYLKFGPHAAGYARATGWFAEDPLWVQIVGGVEETATWRETCLSTYHPHRLVESLDPARDAGRLEQLGLPASQGPRAYLCYRGSCSAPAESPEELARALQATARAPRKA